jgi:glycosyltransferase involved in cell wall biosynthesis
MRVLHVLPGLSTRQGGLQAAAREQCLALIGQGVHCVVAALAEPDAPDPAWEAVPYKLFQPLWRRLGSSPALRRWLHEQVWSFDAVVGHCVWLEPFRYAARAARRAGRPFFAVAHGMLDGQALRQRPLRKAVRARMGVREALEGATAVYTCAAEQERAAMSGADSVVIPLSVEVPRLPPGDAPEGPVVCVARLHPRKGVLEFARAARRLKERVAFVHAGPVEDAAYAREVYGASQGSVGFRGPLSHGQVMELLDSARIVVAPATVAENFGLAIVEGMSRARAVVAGRAALMTPELEAAGVVRGAECEKDGLAAAIEGLLSEPYGRHELGLRAYAYAASHFSRQAAGLAWLEKIKATGRKAAV